MRPSDDLARIASHYSMETFEIIPSNVGQWEQVLPPDPYRWYLYFSPGLGAFDQLWVLPGGPSAGSYGLSLGFEGLEFRFRDSPATVCSSWWVMSSAGMALRVLAERFLGG